MGRVSESEDDNGMNLKEGWFVEAQRDLAVAISEETSAVRCLEIGAGEVESLLDLLGVLVGETEKRMGRKEIRARIMVDGIEEAEGRAQGEGNREDVRKDIGVVQGPETGGRDTSVLEEVDDPTWSTGEHSSKT